LYSRNSGIRQKYCEYEADREMLNIHGTITLSGINDSQLSKLFEFKAKNEGTIQFNPSAMQPVPQNKTYNNVVLTWNSLDSFHAVHKIVTELDALSAG
jgi:hypothetical protein